MGDMSESLGIAGPGRRWRSREDHVGQDRPVDLMDSASTLPTTPQAQPHRAKAQKINEGVTHLPGTKCHLSIRSYSEGLTPGSTGFTLVELLVVMVIIALLMTGVPRLIAGLPGVRLRAAADDMADRLKGLHSEALRRGATMALIVDPAARTYRISTDTLPHPLPEVVDRVDVKSSGILPADGTAQISFFADGTATAGMVRLRHGRRAAAITVDWLTGRVRRDE